ncbi:beta-ketoacyl-ACP synthase II [Schleiferia thermophila]|uniref:3-oxoacyl-[acyl-carrier-protein] synthase 2 n=1 Tax=Schleiferia thermophila TaxID=884107 RepID=A0A369A6V2_9FLAO|nr:beta-ketoacyl-ACP synthase II [Schleiferia thermophila]RCX04871.1 3-oxoacyl-[acyl-carrier-protein] synthase II [Schleiferia thermophila]GCD79605.1 3-oxoacyl-[acyl-carrier-protein] synthase 2 [Schleiferia thermophila]
MTQARRVVITGVGAITPIGNTAQEYLSGLKNGVSGASFISAFDTEKFKTRFACEVKNFDVNQFIDRKEARRMDRFTHFALVCADEAIKDAGLDREGSFDPDRTGVIWGSGIGGLDTFLKESVEYAKGDGTPRFNPFFIPKMIADIAPGHISIKYGFRGPNFSTVSACASSTNALIDAYIMIKLGKADVVVSGGSEAAITEAGIGGFNAMQALSTRNDSPETASRPFDKDRDGFVMGEGGACLILEELEHALARGAKIYAEVAGFGLSADAHHITAPHPDGLGAANVMRYAIEDAGLSPADIDYINVHGTSTPLGDIAEVKAIQKVFGDHVYQLNISSTKSMTGHLLGGAGAVEALATVFAICHDFVPPTINHFTDDPDLDPAINFTFNKAQQRTVRAALSNTFGFGGHNASILFKKYH